MKQLVAVVLLCAGCSSNAPADCSEAGAGEVGVFVIDSSTHAPLCGYYTHLYGNNYESIAPGGWGTSPCDGLQEIRVDREDQGAFRIEVGLRGYEAAEAPIRIFTGACGDAISPDGPRDGLPGYRGYVTIALDPSP